MFRNHYDFCSLDPSPHKTIDSKPSLPSLLRLFSQHGAESSFMEIGIGLGIKISDLRSILETHGRSFEHLFKLWLNSGMRNIDWGFLISVLESKGVERQNIARKIRKELHI